MIDNVLSDLIHYVTEQQRDRWLPFLYDVKQNDIAYNTTYRNIEPTVKSLI